MAETPDNAAKAAPDAQQPVTPAAPAPTAAAAPVTPSAPAKPAAPPATAATATAAAPAPKGPPKVKVRKHKQRSCDEKNEKGKLCAGHLKRWYTYPKAIESLIGPHSEIYRCEFCHTLYRPDPEQLPNSYTLRY